MGFPGLVWGGEKRERSLSVTSVESDHFTLSQQDPWARIFPNVLHKREGLNGLWSTLGGGLMVTFP